MRRFVLQGNVEHYKRRLAEVSDDAETIGLNRLLADAEQELQAHTAIWKQTCPHLSVSPARGHLLENLLEKAVDIHQAQYGSLQLWDGEARALYLVAQYNFGAQFVRDFPVVRRGDGTLCDQAVARGGSVHVVDVQSAPEFRILWPFAFQNGIHAIQSTPITSQAGDLLGVFSTHFTRQKAFTADERADWGMIARHAAMIIESEL